MVVRKRTRVAAHLSHSLWCPKLFTAEVGRGEKNVLLHEKDAHDLGSKLVLGMFHFCCVEVHTHNAHPHQEEILSKLKLRGKSWVPSKLQPVPSLETEQAWQLAGIQTIVCKLLAFGNI